MLNGLLNKPTLSVEEKKHRSSLHEIPARSDAVSGASFSQSHSFFNLGLGTKPAKFTVDGGYSRSISGEGTRRAGKGAASPFDC
jgi:hypothetical protein